MSLPSQEVLDDIRDLISEITNFQENDENFAICERYCLSHVVHHTYPFVNRNSVKSLVSSYVSRFYSHGYFKVSQELDHQVQKFLTNETLFEKNAQYDIQWCLLSLLTSLSSNLTLLKEVPELLPIDIEETETEDFDWKEYLMNDLPLQISYNLSSDSEEMGWDNDEENDNNDDGNEENKGEVLSLETTMDVNPEKKNLEIIFDNKSLFNSESASEIRKQKIEEFLKSKKSKIVLDNDIRLRGNITEKFDALINQEGIVRRSQPISELEMMENILFQFQTGERIFLRRGLVNPALTSLTQLTLCDYLDSLQPYFRIVRRFKDFDLDISEARYSQKYLEKSFCSEETSRSSSAVVRQVEGSIKTSADETELCRANFNELFCSVASRKKKISNVLYIYNAMLRKALEPFQREITDIVENLGNYTLIQMEQKLKPYYDDLSSLFYVHNLATKNWEKDSNWMSSVRILSVLYTAIMDATSLRMSFLFLNFFLRCFQVYLDLIDTWISFVDLIDPCDEFIVFRSSVLGSRKVEDKCSEYEIRPYKAEIENSEVKNVEILDFIGEKMIHVGQSLEILKRLNRFIAEETETPKESSYALLVKAIDRKINSLGLVKSGFNKVKMPEKQKSIFTMKNVNLRVERDNGGGDCSVIKDPINVTKGDKENDKGGSQVKQADDTNKEYSYSDELINSVVKNPFFKMAFENVGMKQVQRQLEEAKARQKQDSGDEALTVIRKPEDGKIGIYPFHKIITEALPTILENRVSGACALVKDIVLKECNLPMHLSLLRSILLFNDSYLIQPFISAIFTQPFIWGSSYSLSLHLKECVRSFNDECANAFSVVLKKKAFTRCENILQVIDVITVNYEVKWPLSLIITPETLRKYNEIFRVALKLKWAHWALCNLHFQGEREEEKDIGDERSCKSTCHRHRLLRFWFLSALGRINNYFLAQMTPSDITLSSLSDLKEIIRGHAEFLEKIHHNCLLGGKSPEGRKLIFETLIPLCMDLLQEDCNTNDAKLCLIEKKFESCHLLLSRLLSSLEK